MRRTIIAGVLTLAAVQLALPTASQACQPGDLEGWVIANAQGYENSPVKPLGTENGYVATIDSYYVGVGTWKLRIDRPLAKPTKKKKFERIWINSPADGSPAYAPKGVIKEGDHIKGFTFGPASALAFGNAGCV